MILASAVVNRQWVPQHGSVQFEVAQNVGWDQRRFAAPAHHQFLKVFHGGPALEASLSHPTLKLGRASGFRSGRRCGETRALEPRQGKTGPKPKWAEHRERILDAVREDSAITLNDLREKLQLPACVATLWQALRTWGLVLKKSPEGR